MLAMLAKLAKLPPANRRAGRGAGVRVSRDRSGSLPLPPFLTGTAGSIESAWPIAASFDVRYWTMLLLATSAKWRISPT